VLLVKQKNGLYRPEEDGVLFIGSTKKSNGGTPVLLTGKIVNRSETGSAIATTGRGSQRLAMIHAHAEGGKLTLVANRRRGWRGLGCKWLSRLPIKVIFDQGHKRYHFVAKPSGEGRVSGGFVYLPVTVEGTVTTRSLWLYYAAILLEAGVVAWLLRQLHFHLI